MSDLLTKMNLPEYPAGTKVVSILSGGLDSTVLTYAAVAQYGAENVIALSFDYGQRHKKELEMAALTCKKLRIAHKIIDIGFLGQITSNVCCLSKDSELNPEQWVDEGKPTHDNTVVPYRNMILASISFAFAESNGCKAVICGNQPLDTNGYWDCRTEFNNLLNKISMLNDKGVAYLCPLMYITKPEEILLGIELGMNPKDTWTCYRGGEKACGVCASCVERLKAFKDAGVKDPTEYEQLAIE